MSSEDFPQQFAELGLSTPVLKALKEVGYETPSPIQAASIPPLLAGRDLLGQAQTGTGKTAAFALPMLSRFGNNPKGVQALVLTPTRELAIQVAEALQSYARFVKNFHVLPVYGGQDISGQLRQLRRGVQVVVGTPGRLLDHLKRRSMDLSNLQTLVLDEADEMLRMGFIDDVTEILSHTPENKQTALFSATLPKPIMKVAERFLKEPEHIRIESSTTTVDTIDQYYWLANQGQKLDILTRILETEDFDAVIIFSRTRGGTTELADKMTARGYACAAINGDINQNQREKTIRQLKNGQIDILVATDVAARGLDVERISHVINYDIPYDSEAYVHRIGRTGRAGRRGKAILFVSHREKRLLYTIEKATRQRIAQFSLPSSKEIAAQRRERFAEKVTAALAETPQPFFTDLIAELGEKADVSEAQVAAALAYMLQKDKPLVPPPTPKSEPRPKSDKRDRPERKRNEKPGKRARKDNRDSDVSRELYRIEAGRDHQVTPKDIVGAIANEADLDAQYIGQIEIFDHHSTVELPTGMPRDLQHHLQKTRVRQQPMRLSRVDAYGKPAAEAPRKPRKRKLDAKSKPARKPNADK